MNVGLVTCYVTAYEPVLVAVPPGVVSVIGPPLVPDGTVTRTCVADTTLTDAATPPIVAAWTYVRRFPVTVTTVPTGPLAGVNDEIVGWALGAGVL